MMEVLPFNHKTNSFMEAVSISPEELKECLAEPSKFDELSVEKKLRMVSLLGHVSLRMLADCSHPAVKLFFYLSFEPHATYSEHVELIEKGLLKLLEERNEPYDKILRNIFLALRLFFEGMFEAENIVKAIAGLTKNVPVH